MQAIAFASGGGQIAAGDIAGVTRVWNLRTGQAVEVRGHEGTITGLAFSPDGASFATASEDETGGIWDARTGTSIAELRGHRGLVLGAAFAPDGRTVVTGSTDGMIRTWAVASDPVEAVLDAPTGKPLRDVGFAPGGKRLVTASEDLTARVWISRAGASCTFSRTAAAATRGSRARGSAATDSMFLQRATTGRPSSGAPPQGGHRSQLSGKRVDRLCTTLRSRRTAGSSPPPGFTRRSSSGGCAGGSWFGGLAASRGSTAWRSPQAAPFLRQLETARSASGASPMGRRSCPSRQASGSSRSRALRRSRWDPHRRRQLERRDLALGSERQEASGTPGGQPRRRHRPLVRRWRSLPRRGARAQGDGERVVGTPRAAGDDAAHAGILARGCCVCPERPTGRSRGSRRTGRRVRLRGVPPAALARVPRGGTRGTRASAAGGTPRSRTRRPVRRLPPTATRRPLRANAAPCQRGCPRAQRRRRLPAGFRPHVRRPLVRRARRQEVATSSVEREVGDGVAVARQTCPDATCSLRSESQIALHELEPTAMRVPPGSNAMLVSTNCTSPVETGFDLRPVGDAPDTSCAVSSCRKKGAASGKRGASTLEKRPSRARTSSRSAPRNRQMRRCRVEAPGSGDEPAVRREHGLSQSRSTLFPEAASGGPPEVARQSLAVPSSPAVRTCCPSRLDPRALDPRVAAAAVRENVQDAPALEIPPARRESSLAVTRDAYRRVRSRRSARAFPWVRGARPRPGRRRRPRS